MRISKYIRLSFISAGVIISASFNGFAQDKVNQEVKVVKPYEPVISDAFKISELPKLEDTISVVPEFEYDIMPKQFETSFIPKSIKPARLISEPLSKLYYGYVKVGFGSYITPLADVYVGSKRNEDWIWGAKLNHLSSHGKVKNTDNEKVYSGFSNTKFAADGKHFFDNKQTLGFGAEYNHKKHYYYGYDPDLITDGTAPPLKKDEIENQSANLFVVKGRWKSDYLDSVKTNFDVNTSFQSFSAKNGIGENAFKLNADVNYFFEKEFIGVDAGLSSYSSAGIPDTIMQTIVKFNPWIGVFGDKWQIVAGVNTYLHQLEQKYYIYPRLSMHYNIIDYFLIPYLEVGGSLKENSYQSIFYENPYIKQDIGVLPTSTKLDIAGGFRGNISSSVAFNVKASYAFVEDQYFYVNDTTVALGNKFNVVYDDMKRVSLLGEVAYQNNENLMLRLKANYYHYNLSNELQAWHKPDYKVSLSARYKIKNKIIIDGTVYAIGSRYAREFNTDGTVYAKELQGIIDLNLGVEYRLTKKLSAFLTMNNLAAMQYHEWNHYPTQRFNIMAGITYAL